MSFTDDTRTISSLVGNAVEQLGKLMQNEVQLAKAELSQKVTQASMGAAFLGAAAVLAIPVLVLLLISLALWLGQMGLSPPLAHLVSAVVGAAIAGVLAMVGKSYLKPANLTPKVTIRQVERDVAAAKEMTR